MPPDEKCDLDPYLSIDTSDLATAHTWLQTLYGVLALETSADHFAWRARIANLVHWLQESAPDIVCLQEIKSEDDQFPRLEVEALEVMPAEVECDGAAVSEPAVKVEVAVDLPKAKAPAAAPVTKPATTVTK